ncbi:hypothetical protein MIR68_004153 [Amoeboaphelidium protococcarum]|nr:hypothetical protein MIR68_004153 [Amoeboaphelidium protococcarum]
MTTPTKDSLLALLKRKQLNAIANELEQGITTIEDMTTSSKDDWKEIAGVAPGIDIYNHLHISPQLDYHNVAAVELVGKYIWPELESLPQAEVLGSVLNGPLPFFLNDGSYDVLPGIFNDQHSANAVFCSELGHICGGIVTMHKQLSFCYSL